LYRPAGPLEREDEAREAPSLSSLPSGQDRPIFAAMPGEVSMKEGMTKENKPLGCRLVTNGFHVVSMCWTQLGKKKEVIMNGNAEKIV
jgi:hypothetical protein